MSGSAGGGTVIREFLVRIGYFEAGRKEFRDGIASVTEQALKLAVEIKAAALAVEAAVAIISTNLEQVYFLAQRTGASAEGIRALGFAAVQVGGSVEGLRGSIENLGRFIRTNPGAANFFESLGVSARQANGQLRATDDILADLLKNLRQRQPAVGAALANMLGIDEKLFLGQGAEFDAAQARYRKLQQQAHFNAKQATEDAHFFMSQLRDLGRAIGLLQDKVASAFTRSMGEEIGHFTDWLGENFDRIDKIIRFVADQIIEAGKIVIDFGKFLWQLVREARDAWNSFDRDTKVFLEAMGAVVALIKGFDLLMGMSLFGRILLVGLAIAALVQDYRAWKEGAESVIDWKKWEPVLLAMEKAFWDIGKAVKDLALTIKDVLGKVLKENEGKLSDLFDPAAIKKNIEEITKAITWIPKTVEGYVKFWGGVATGNWKLALEGLQDIKNQTMGEGAPPFMQGLPEMAGEQARQGPWWSQAGRWIRGRLGGGAVPARNAAETALTPESRGLLDTIAGTEAPGYNALYGGGSFADYSAHPNRGIPIRSGPNQGKLSTAAGRYQFTFTTWERARAALNLPDFSPQSQDRAAWWLAQDDYRRNSGGRDLAADLRSGDPAVRSGIGRFLSPTWTSLPGGIESTTTEGRFLRELQENTAREQALTNQRPGTGIAAPRPDPRMGDVNEIPPSAAPTPRPPPWAGRPSLTAPNVDPRDDFGVVPLGTGPQSMNDNSRTISFDQPTNIVVNAQGATDPYAIGRSVEAASRTAAQQNVRDFTSKVS